MIHRIGFVATRFAGTDGVSLESAKWAQLLSDDGHLNYWYAGELDRELNSSFQVPEAHFTDADNAWIDVQVFGTQTRAPEVKSRVQRMGDYLKDTLYEFIGKFEIEVLVVENALSIPMHIPLGVALTQLIAETGIPVIGHHHDFYWERTRFAVNAVNDFLAMAFPPALPSIQHVTINSPAQQALSLRKGESSMVVPNVLDFENPPPEPDGYGVDFRTDIGLAPDDIVFLQPTRVVPRKGIEHSIALLSKLKNPKCKLLVSHESGDEGDDYMLALTDMAKQEGVDLRFVDTRVGRIRASTPEGVNMYDLQDAYSQADFITYPSLYEGFGNALVEAFYFRKPVLVNRYAIFITDIEPKGFRVITMDGYLTREVVSEVECVLANDEYRREMVDHNYELAKAYFSYSVLTSKLRALIANATGN